VQRINVNTKCAWYEKTTTRKGVQWRREGAVGIPPAREPKLKGEEMYALVRWVQERCTKSEYGGMQRIDRTGQYYEKRVLKRTAGRRRHLPGQRQERQTPTQHQLDWKSPLQHSSSGSSQNWNRRGRGRRAANAWATWAG